MSIERQVYTTSTYTTIDVPMGCKLPPISLDAEIRYQQRRLEGALAQAESAREEINRLVNEKRKAAK